MRRANPNDDFLGETHVYEPHRRGLPNMRVYVRELWRRRQFAYELARTSLRSVHFDTAFGQLWLILNPLLLGCVYYLLVVIISQAGQDATFFAHLLAGLFAFYYIAGAMSAGAKSVVGSGRLILNTAFPRALLPLSSTFTAFFRFVPTLVVYAVVHLMTQLPIGPHLLLVVLMIGILSVFAAGMAMIFAVLQVYFRDTSSFLPYFNRIWLYLSPVLYFPDQIPDSLRALSALNPLYWILGAWSEILVHGTVPSATSILASVGWALGAFAVGGILFVSREREFAVRL
jgi:teichoic acid transport system permease protein